MIKTTLAIAAVNARLTPGSCDDVKMIANFDKARYVGKWFEQARDKLNPYSISADCITKEYALNDQGDVDLYFRGFYGLMQKYTGVNGCLYQCDEGSPDTWTCQATMGGGSHRIPFGIFDTDYETYDIMYSCENHAAGFLKNEMFSVSTRDENPSKETMDAIKKVIAKKIPQYDLDKAWGLSHDHQGASCDYEWHFDHSDDELEE